MPPFTIAHISDLHLSSEHRRINIRNTHRLLEHISRLGVNHVVMTGDITANAEQKDFNLARSILGSHGLLDPGRISVVVGNHDVFGGVHTPEDLLTFSTRCRSVDYTQKVNEFTHSFIEAFDNCTFGAGSSLYPYVKTVDTVALIGLNSVAPFSRLGNPVGSNGEVNRQQLDNVKTLLSSPMMRGRRKIVLIHHHFHEPGISASGAMENAWGLIERTTMRLRKKRALLRLFSEHGVELVLHGHSHQTMQYTIGDVKFSNAGGSILSKSISELSFSLVSIFPHEITIENHTIPAQANSPERKRPAFVPHRVPLHAAA